MGIRARIGISFERLFAPRNVAFSVVSCCALIELDQCQCRDCRRAGGRLVVASSSGT